MGADKIYLNGPVVKVPGAKPEASIYMGADKIYLNGRVVKAQGAKIPVFDRGLNYGDGLFETVKASGGEAEYLKDHLDRLQRGALALGFPRKSLEPLLKDIRHGAIQRLLKANGLEGKAAYLKIVVTRGQSERGLQPASPPYPLVPTFIMTTGAVDEKGLARMRKKGIKAILSRGPSPAIPGVKTLNYLPGVLAKMEAGRAGVEEAIFTGPEKELLEATGSNLFIVERGVLKTPPTSENPFAPGVLPGIMRKAVIGLAGSLGIKVMAQRLHRDDLKRCAEALLTNSVWGIVPLVEADETPVGDGFPGPVTRRLQGLVQAASGAAKGLLS